MIGKEIYKFAEELWPIDRSITGDGLRKTLEKIKEHIPALIIHSEPSNKQVFDWIIPQEWRVNNAYIITPSGKRICDYKTNNLHLLNYSTPFHGKLSFAELKKHLFSLESKPDAIPYVTSYYEKRWGFCISFNELKALEEGIYEVCVDTELFDGVINYGELIIPGESETEVLLSTYVCHPSMANNELSGPTVLTFIAKWLSELPSRYFTYRIVFVPETIGSILYLSKNYEHLQKNVCAGFNISCVGDDRAYSYLPSRAGDTISDRVAKHALKWIDPNYIQYSWLDRGSDERQYCAPGIDLPIASILRSKYAEYPEYHTSLDDLTNVVSPSGLEGGFNAIKSAISILEIDKVYQVQFLCEPQMGRRGLYPSVSSETNADMVRQMMDLISYCDGEHSLLDIAEILQVSIFSLNEQLRKLLQSKIILEQK